MNLKKSVEHFRYKLDPKNKIWKATQHDINALNGIMEYVEKTEAENLLQNQSLAKFYVYILKNLLIKFNESVYDKAHSAEFNMILSMPLTQHIEDLKEHLNSSEMYVRFNKGKKPSEFPQELRHIHESRIEDFLDDSITDGQKMKWIAKFRKEKAENRERINTLHKENPEWFTTEAFDYDTVEDVIKNTVTNIINKYE